MVAKAYDIATLPGLAALWEVTSGAPEIRVAILDGPVDRAHPCLDDASLFSVPTVVPDTAGEGRMSAHGTHVASLIFGQHGRGPVRGVAPSCSGLVVPIFSDRRGATTSQMELARAINQAVDLGAHVINVSGGELLQSTDIDPSLVNAVQHCQDQGTLIVAAAGNDSCECLHVPAALPTVLAVGAMDAAGAPLETSNWGDVYRYQGILAPGVNLPGAIPGGGLALKSGTSFATAIVSGVAALLASAQRQQGRDPDPHAVREAILGSAITCDERSNDDCRRCLAGRLNVSGAHALTLTGGDLVMSDAHATSAAPQPAAPAVNAAPSTRMLQPAEAPTGDVGAAASCVAEPATANPALHPSAAPNGVSDGTAPAAVAAPAPAPSGLAPNAVQPNEAVAAAPPPRFDGNGGAAPVVVPSAVDASACSCQGGGGAQPVFAIGVLNYDFGTEARRDSFKQLMPNVNADGAPYLPGDPTTPPPRPANPYDVRQIVHYLGGYPFPSAPYPLEGGFPRTDLSSGGFPREGDEFEYPESKRRPANLPEATQLIWTLCIELTPVYAIRPRHEFATEVYQRLVQCLAGQILDSTHPEFVERVSICGSLTGETVRLFSGQVVPVVEPQLRGMYSWNSNAIAAEAIAAARVSEDGDEAMRIGDNLKRALDRIYYDLRNLGQTPAERALNYSATNVFQAAAVFGKSFSTKKQLDAFTVEKSAFCRMDSDCWDVKWKFFDPENVLRAKDLYRTTVDVSDVYPVTVGEIREWSISG